MSMDRTLALIRSFDGVLELAPEEGSEFPPIAWGDHFFYYAPDGQVPQREQPYATIVTKNYPDDTACDLDRPDRWRLNIHVGTETFVELTGERPRIEGAQTEGAQVEGVPAERDYAAADVVLPHPVYRAQGWVAVVNPGPATRDLVDRLLRQAHDDARRRARRREA